MTKKALQIFSSSWLLPLFLISMAEYGVAQQQLPQGDNQEQYYRLLQISGEVDERASMLLRPVVPGGGLSQGVQWLSNTPDNDLFVNREEEKFRISFYEPVWFQSLNTVLPRGGLDGSIWQGKGYNTSVSGGFYANYGPLHLTYRPQMGFAQNQSFDLGPYEPPVIRTSYFRGEASEYAYRSFRGTVDAPVRFGPDLYSWFDLGDSSLELRFYELSVGLSNQRIWTGPGIHNSIQFGYNGPGFLHVRLGTFRPIETMIGDFELMYLFGGIRKSDFYSDGVRNMDSVNSLSIVYSPWFAPGLSIGVLRTFLQAYPESFSEYRGQVKKLYEPVSKIKLVNEENPSGSDPDNQIASFFARWYVPDSGFELYFEYGRNDHNVRLRDFRNHIDHARAYLLGMQKTTYLAQDRFIAVGVELMQSETPRNTLLRAPASPLGGWYTHAQQVAGFSNRGQLLGTSFGPGANVQMVTADLFADRGLLGATVARIVYHNSKVDQYFEQLLSKNDPFTERWQIRNVEFMVGLRSTFFTAYDLEIGASIEQSWILNHHNIASNDTGNTRFELTIRKKLDGWLR